jgi:hypothetical protein
MPVKYCYDLVGVPRKAGECCVLHMKDLGEAETLLNGPEDQRFQALCRGQTGPPLLGAVSQSNNLRALNTYSSHLERTGADVRERERTEAAGSAQETAAAAWGGRFSTRGRRHKLIGLAVFYEHFHDYWYVQFF